MSESPASPTSPSEDQKKQKKKKVPVKDPPGMEAVTKEAEAPHPDPALSLEIVICGYKKNCELPALAALYTSSKYTKGDFDEKKKGKFSLQTDEKSGLVNVTLRCQEEPEETPEIKSADGIIFGFTPLLEHTLLSVRSTWIPLIHKCAQPDVVTALCATRLDLANRHVRKGGTVLEPSHCALEAQHLKLNSYFETSSRNNKGVRHAIEQTVKMALNKKLGDPPPLYELTEAEVVRLNEVRASVKAPRPKSVWKQIEKNGRYRYWNRKTGEQRRTRPPDFDGVDVEAEEREKTNRLRLECLAERDNTEKEIISDHVMRVSSYQEQCLEIARENAFLNKEIIQLRKEESRLCERRKEWIERSEAVKLATAAEMSNRAEEDLAIEEEISEKKVLEESCREEERKLLEHPVTIDPSRFRLKAEANAQLESVLSIEEQENKSLVSQNKEIQSKLNNCIATNNKLTHLIDFGNKRYHDEKTAVQSQRERLAKISAKRDQMQSDLVRAKELEGQHRLFQEHRDQADDMLAQEIDKMELDIMHHHKNKTSILQNSESKLEDLRVSIDGYKSSRTQLSRELAALSATDDNLLTVILNKKNSYLEALTVRDDLYETHYKLIEQALKLPLRVANIFDRHARYLLKKAAKLTEVKRSLDQKLTSLQNVSNLGLSQVLTTNVMSDTVRMGHDDKRPLVLSKQINKLTQQRATLKQEASMLTEKASICRVEHGYLERVLRTRLEDRANHGDYSRQLVSHVDSVLNQLSQPKPQEWHPPTTPMFGLLPGSNSDHKSLALGFSSGLLPETRSNLLAAEAFIIRRRHRKQAVAAKKSLEMKSLETNLAQKVSVKSFQPTPSQIMSFASKAAVLADEDKNYINQMGSYSKKQIPAALQHTSLEKFPVRLEPCVTGKDYRYRKVASEAWVECASAV
eukprot:TRINITY_DN24397_c0_g1_i1.p1 TRINITY_DN24397_c0_g1~~TRINITY_DN24397_c0_g1_i1.p1  ORF type:complete len:928 (+),score=224.19 TRINITY_DN24397_c0_g1_i1:34-2784(+)